MKTRYLLVTLICVLIATNAFAQKVTIRGYVLDNKSKEPIIGANIFNPITLQGTTTNKFGFYSFAVDRGESRLKVSFVGYSAFQSLLNVTSDTLLNIMLQEGETIETINVYSELSQPQTAITPVSITSKQMRLLPSLTGEADLMKAFQYLPGISQGSEGDNSLYVRGGSPDQNLILLDDVPLYYINHIGGLVSIFDENAVNDVSVYKGGFPARYGGRLSSVVDVQMKNGSLEKIKGEISVGLISSKLFVEGPLIKDKVSFMFTARKSMTDLYMRPLSSKITDGEGYMVYSFYDLNGKINYKLSDKDRFYLSLYNGADNVLMNVYFDSEDRGMASNTDEDFAYEAKAKHGWGNTMGCFRWNHIYGNKLFSNFTMALSHYYYLNSMDNKIKLIESGKTSETYIYEYSSGVNDKLAKLDFDYYPFNNHHVRFGGVANFHQFNTGKLHQLYDINEDALSDSAMLIRNYESEIDTTYGSSAVNALEASAYLEDEMTLFRFLIINAGIHFANYNYNEKNYQMLQPRISLRTLLGNGLSVNASYSRMGQFIHMLTGSDTSTPTDIWVPATDRALPEKSDQYSLGVEKVLKENGLKVSVEGFYKTMENLVDYKLGYSLMSSTDRLYDKIESGGTGTVYGAEFLLEKNTGKLTGWIGYTYSKNMRQFANINGGVPYHYVYDRPHNLSVVANYALNKKITLSATWEFQSGRRMTIGTVAYDANVLYLSQDIPAHGSEYYLNRDQSRHQFAEFGTQIATIYGTKNNYKLEDYHKLNLSAHFAKQKKHGTRVITVGVQNVYNRMNPYNVYYSTLDDGTIVLKKMTLFPIMPSISYSFKF